MTHTPDSSASPEPVAEPDENQYDDDAANTPRWRTFAGWAVALLAAVALGATAIWQVNERVYTPESTAGQYWDALSEGSGSRALGLFETVPDLSEQPDIDHLLLSGEPLSTSIGMIDDAELIDSTSDESPQLSFTVEGEEHTTELPMSLVGRSWGFFDHWAASPRALSWFEVEVPGAPEGGIGQVEVNGEPVNLNEETAELAAFVPTVAEVQIDSQWLVGSARHVVTSEDDDESAERLTIDLEASEAATELLHEEVSSFFETCSEEQVLMPASCPVGATSTDRVDASTIEWEFPSPDEISLSFDAEGWQVEYEELTAVLTYEADDSFTGERLNEREEMPFALDVQVATSGSDLMVSVRGLEAEGAD